MNGEDKKLALDLWNVWREQHDANSKEVRDDVKWLVKEFGKLPCDRHSERMKGIKVHLALLWSFFTASLIIFGIVVRAIGG